MKNNRKSVLIRSAVIAAVLCVLGLSWSLRDRLSGDSGETLISADSGNAAMEYAEDVLPAAISTDAAALGAAAEQFAVSGTAETVSVRAVPAVTEAPEEERQLIYVYVCGEVQKPGVYRCAADARVTDAVELAGGATEQAAALALNLAAPLQDGQMLWLPSQEEYEALRQDTQSRGEFPACVQPADDGGREKDAAADGRINLNTAGKEALMTLPGIGAQKAEKIIAYRTEHGGFGSAEEIKQIPGIKQKAYEKLKDRITVQ